MSHFRFFSASIVACLSLSIPWTLMFFMRASWMIAPMPQNGSRSLSWGFAPERLIRIFESLGEIDNDSLLIGFCMSRFLTSVLS